MNPRLRLSRPNYGNLRASAQHPILDLTPGTRYLAVEMLSVAAQSRSDDQPARRAKVAAASHAATNPEALPKYYGAMLAAQGTLNWWPAKTRFEVIVGAILTQNSGWVNVEKAIRNLRREKMLSVSAIERVPRARLARLIRSSGYFRQKAKKLKAFVRFLRQEYSGSLARMFGTATAELRERLLAVHGIGPETADSILLYAGKRSVFVVDAYTRRIVERHGHISSKTSYEEIRGFFEGHLAGDHQLYNEYHAQIGNVGKNWCRPRNPQCDKCPLGAFLPSGASPLSQPSGAKPLSVQDIAMATSLVTHNREFSPNQAQR